MYKICVIGDYDSVLSFMTIGFSVFFVSSEVEASIILSKVLQDDYSIILISDYYLKLSEDLVKKYSVNKQVGTIVPLRAKESLFGSLKLAN